MQTQLVLWILVFGLIIGVLFKARHLPWVALLGFCLGWAGFFLAGSSHNEAMIWFFGVALMSSPVIGVIAIPGVIAGQLLRMAMRKLFRERGPTESKRWSD